MAIILVLALAVSIVTSNISANSFTTSFSQSSPGQKNEQITINAIFAEPKDRWDMLVKGALDELRQRHPEVDIQINYTVLPYNITREQMLKALSSPDESGIDLVSVDQIWLGEFAQRGLLADLSNRTENWGRLSDWYEANLDGNLYDDKIYGI
jgi:multiple sugar transport system substrate-binding protein